MGTRVIVGLAVATCVVIVAGAVWGLTWFAKVWRATHYTPHGPLTQISPPTHAEPQDNGFEQLAKAASALRPHREAIAEAQEGPWNARGPEIARLLKQCHGPLTAARKALRKECLHPLPRGISDTFPYMGDLRHLAWLMIVEGRQDELAGRLDQAAQCYSEVFALAPAAARNGLLTHATAAAYITTSACEELERCAGPGGMNEHALRVLDAQLAKALAERVPESETLAVEWVIIDQSLNDLASGRIGPDGQPRQTAQPNPAERAIAESGRAETNEIVAKAIEDARRPYWQRSHEEPRPQTIMGVICAPVTKGFYSHCAQRDVLLEGLRVLIAITRYRHTAGALPTTLQALTPKYLDAVPVDPFDGQLLRYARRGGDYVLYSVGPNGKDEGGAQRIDWEANTGDLIIWPAGPVGIPKPASTAERSVTGPPSGDRSADAPAGRR